MSTVHEATFEVLRAHGHTTMFGNPGSTELPMLADFPDDFRYVLGLNESVVIGMADGYAQATGSPVLVNLHSAPGIASAMGALVNAAAARLPLVLTAGQQVRAMITSQALLTNPDPVTLPKPLVKWSFEPPRAQDVPAALVRALLLANQPPRGPVLVSLPMDDWSAPVDDEAVARLRTRTVAGRVVPEPGAVRAVAERLAAARNPVLLVGADVDAGGGWAAAVALAERCRLPVYWAPLEPRCGFPTDHPAFQGVLPPSEVGVAKALEGHDLVLVAGAAVFRYYAYVPGEPLPDGAEVVMFTNDADEAARAPFGDAIVGDVATALRWLVAAVPPTARPDPPLGLRPRAVDVEPLTPAAVYALLAEALPAEAVVVAESISTMRDCQEQIPFRRPGAFLTAAGASLGFGVPAAIGVRLAQPERPVVAVVGDGALHYSLPALWTAARYDVPVLVVVIRNDRYAVLEDFRDLLGLTGVPGLRLGGVDHVALAQGYGVPARRVDSAGELRAALAEAARMTGPRLLEVPVAGEGATHW